MMHTVEVVTDMKLTKMKLHGQVWLVTVTGSNGNSTTAVVKRQAGESLADAAGRIEEKLAQLQRGEVKPLDLTA